MAMRRSFGGDSYEGYPDQPEDGLGDLFNPVTTIPGMVKRPTADQHTNMTGAPEFGNDDGGGILPTPAPDSQGNATTSREMWNNQPTTPGLPQGMTVQGEDSGMDNGQSAFSTPLMPHEPTPISGMRSTPDVTQRVSSPGAQSALFSDTSGGTPLFGQAGGLMGGGKGVFGGEQGGPSTPTQMMLSLLRMFRNGA